jgi:arginine/ornithine N-succinyltransferase beta subunit
VLAIIAIMSTVGLVTGFFLKHLDSVLKAVASALEAHRESQLLSFGEEFWGTHTICKFKNSSDSSA